MGIMSDNDRYKIVKFYRDPTKKPRVVKRGLTLIEAKAHCNRADTHGDGWFDAFTRDS